MRPIDLRSDTFTLPDPAMRRAMAGAEVGDDVWGEDPTVRRLEEEAAEAVGHEAALFVPTGTMGNQVALHLHSRRAPQTAGSASEPAAARRGWNIAGGEVICDRASHLVEWEMGAMAAISGLLPRGLEAPGGLLDPEAVERAVDPGDGFHPRTVAIAVENTVNMAGGIPVPPELSDALLAVARRHDLPAHLDGARVFNAAVALGVPAARLASGYDSVMFCLSKGLGAPVGSLLCGGAYFVAEARRVRKMLGGGMRQAGVLAAAGLLALRGGPARLVADHANAARLARGLAELPGFELNLAAVATNVVVFRPGLELLGGEEPAEGRAAASLPRMRQAGVLASPADRDRVRLMTYTGIGERDVETALERLGRLAHRPLR